MWARLEYVGVEPVEVVERRGKVCKVVLATGGYTYLNRNLLFATREEAEKAEDEAVPSYYKFLRRRRR